MENRSVRVGMNRVTLDTITGLFVLIIVAFLALYSIKLGRNEFFGGKYYQVYAEFDSIAGLKNGAAVDIAGVGVGRVDGITLNPKSEMARVRMEINNGIKLQEDDIASVRAQGIIGDRFISISPGGSDRTIPPGGMIEDTESSVDFLQLIGQIIQGRSRSGKNVLASGGKVQPSGGR